MKTTSLSEAEYLERLGGLVEKLRSEMPQASDQEIFSLYREREFDLLIDFRLGADFPKERRQALKKIQQQVLCRMDELMASVSSGKMATHDYAAAIQQLVKEMAAEWSVLLNREEMEALGAHGFPGIPLDPDLIGRR